jgi:hypothetical protein
MKGSNGHCSFSPSFLIEPKGFFEGGIFEMKIDYKLEEEGIKEEECMEEKSAKFQKKLKSNRGTDLLLGASISGISQEINIKKGNYQGKKGSWEIIGCVFFKVKFLINKNKTKRDTKTMRMAQHRSDG